MLCARKSASWWEMTEDGQTVDPCVYVFALQIAQDRDVHCESILAICFGIEKSHPEVDMTF